MSRIDVSKINLRNDGASASAVPRDCGQSAPAELSEEDRSKDAFFARVGDLAETMIAQHGKEFAMGTLVLAAKFIAEGRPLVDRGDGHGEPAGKRV
jgi:hypothetical protein